MPSLNDGKPNLGWPLQMLRKLRTDSMDLTLKVADASGKVLSQASGEEEVILIHQEDYREGDVAIVEAEQAGAHLVLALDDAMSPTLVYLKGQSYALAAPFGTRTLAYSPRAFSGKAHRLAVRAARPHEIAARRNLALNPYDEHGNDSLFPHAYANVETRGEAVFAARNAIDGEKANFDHGFWPHTSWGINRDPKAALTIDFGRPVRLDELALYLRADFPHDAWWRKASVDFSDGSSLDLDLIKSGSGQFFPIEARVVETLKLHSLIKADDPSPFPALTQLEAWGCDA